MSTAAATQKGPPPLMVKPPTGRPNKAPKLDKPAEPARFYLVESETMRIKVAHGDFLLRKGKEIRSDEYDVPMLRKRGVKLREISTPGWFIDAQEKGRQGAQRLKDAGHDVEVPEPFVPIVIDETPPSAA